MITLHILQLLEDNDFGKINESLFWEKLPIDGFGVGIMSRGGPMPRSNLGAQSFDLFSRGKDDLEAARLLERIWEFFAAHEFVCVLPVVPDVSADIYTKVSIKAESNIENVGEDESGKKLWRSSYQAKYVK